MAKMIYNYIVKSPTGKKHIVTSMRQFCKDMGLVYPTMVALAKICSITGAPAKQRTGAVAKWTVYDVIQMPTKPSKPHVINLNRVRGEDHPNSKKWTLLSPVGEIHVTYDILLFCIQNDLQPHIIRVKGRDKDISPVTRGKSKGWRVISMKGRE